MRDNKENNPYFSGVSEKQFVAFLNWILFVWYEHLIKREPRTLKEAEKCYQMLNSQKDGPTGVLLNVVSEHIVVYRTMCSNRWFFFNRKTGTVKTKNMEKSTTLLRWVEKDWGKSVRGTGSLTAEEQECFLKLSRADDIK